MGTEPEVKWKARIIQAIYLDDLLKKLDTCNCPVVHIWPHGFDAIVLYRDTGQYPVGAMN